MAAPLCKECFNFKEVVVTEHNLQHLKETFVNHIGFLDDKLYQKVWFCNLKKKPIFTRSYAEKTSDPDCTSYDI